MSKHTPTPWSRMGHVIYMGSPGSCDAETGEPLWGGFSLQHCPNAEANACHIVKCVNNHDRLVEALLKLVNAIGFESYMEGLTEMARQEAMELLVDLEQDQ